MSLPSICKVIFPNQLAETNIWSMMDHKNNPKLQEQEWQQRFQKIQAYCQPILSIEDLWDADF
jgi:hypothetical protein